MSPGLAVVRPGIRRARLEGAGRENSRRPRLTTRTIYQNASRLLRELEAREGVFAPERAIPRAGRSDSRPLIHGFRRYRELFNSRQLLHLSLLGEAISSIPTDEGEEAPRAGLQRAPEHQLHVRWLRVRLPPT